MNLLEGLSFRFLSAASPSDLEIAKFRVESFESVSLRFLRARDFSGMDY